MSCTIELRGVGYENAAGVLFSPIDLRLQHRQKIGIWGDNGCGKTTLLKICAGLREPTHGEIRLFHQPILDKKDYHPFRHRVQLLFQDSDDQFICPTVLEDVAFGPLNAGDEPEQARLKAQQILEKLNVLHLQEKSPFMLSGGQKRLVALASALVMEPDILLLDEPSNGLDHASREKLARIIADLHCTTLIVSHDREFLNLAACERIFTLNQQGLH